MGMFSVRQTICGTVTLLPGVFSGKNRPTQSNVSVILSNCKMTGLSIFVRQCMTLA